MPPNAPPGMIPFKDYAAKAVELSLDHDQHYVDENHAPSKATVRWETPSGAFYSTGPLVNSFAGIDVVCRCGRPSFWSAKEILRRWDSTKEVKLWNPLIAMATPDFVLWEGPDDT